MAEGERLARIEERLAALSERADKHDGLDVERFSRLFEFMELAEGRVNKKLDKMDTTLEILVAEKNQRDGAIGISKYYAGMIGGIIVFVLQYVGKKLWG